MEHFFKDYTEFSPANDEMVTTKSSYNSGFKFTVDDILDFPKEKEMVTDAFSGGLTASSDHASAVTAVDSCNSSLSGGDDGQFNELCVPYDDLAELEWLSNFVEESYPTDDLSLFLPSAAAKTSPFDSSSSANSAQHSPPIFPNDVIIPAKARSKRSRAAPSDWSTRLLHVSLTSRPKMAPYKKREPSGKKCLHCGSEKTPQWRTGPMGPKTLCNACGVRFKSGRLVPEYRPAASPTFISSKHSNSHRRVLELRKQKPNQSVHSVSDGCDDLQLIAWTAQIHGT